MLVVLFLKHLELLDRYNYFILKGLNHFVQILDRIEDSKTGVVHKDFHVNIPGHRYKEAQEVAQVIGKDVLSKFPWLEGAKPVESDPFQACLNR